MDGKGQTENNVRLVGNGTASGGKYGKVAIVGEGRVKGDLDCTEMSCTGNAYLEGDLTAKYCKVRGNAAVSGNIRSERVAVTGQMNASGSVVSKRLNVRGELSAGDNLKGERMVINGSVQVEGNCEAETLHINGGLSVGGLLNADLLILNICWPSQVGEVGGERIDIRRGHRLMRWLERWLPLFRSGQRFRFTADTIEGDDIHLEFTQAKVVRGHRVNIGPGCDIEKVEYKESFRQSPHSRVASSVRLAAE